MSASHHPPLPVHIPPGYCQYAGGACDQPFDSYAAAAQADVFLAFSSEPPQLAATLDEAIAQLTRSKPNHRWRSWTSLNIGGQIIFCEICRNIRFARVFAADLTVLNFNVVFETAYAIGLSKPVRILRDSSYGRDARELDEFGILDTVGYEDYAKSDDVVQILLKKDPQPVPLPSAFAQHRGAPLYVVLPAIETEGVARVTSALKQSAFRYRTFDANETPRLSLTDVLRHVSSSVGVVLPLLDEKRNGSRVHNARCAFVAGLAMALKRHVLLAQEGNSKQPIDYRDVVQSFTTPRQVQPMIERLVKQVATTLTSSSPSLAPEEQRSQLSRLDLGDIAAENEDDHLASYFVKTSQYQETVRGHARLVVGRKGTGKSAIFSQLRDTFGRRSHDYLVLDLRPEGFQLRKLVDLLQRIAEPGIREQTSMTLWSYVLLTELAGAVLAHDTHVAYREPESLRLYRAIEQAAGLEADSGDFSDRLLGTMSRLESNFPWGASTLDTNALNSALWKRDIGSLVAALSQYLKSKREVWILVDNLDKNWPARGSTETELLILRSLLEASRKIQRQLGRKAVPIRTVVFIRTDIFEGLLSETPDRGKETNVSLDSADHDVLREILRKRAIASLGAPMTFEDFAQRFFDMHVGGEDSFRYLFRHTLGRPRDILRLTKRCVEIALNRGHSRVGEDDMRAAVKAHSTDVLQELIYEIRDSLGDDALAIDDFVDAEQPMARSSVVKLLSQRVPEHAVFNLIHNLLWYSFLGVQTREGAEMYAYEDRYNVDRLLRLGRQANEDELLVVHPSFRDALHIRSHTR